jgi:hypothetical protein
MTMSAYPDPVRIASGFNTSSASMPCARASSADV